MVGVADASNCNASCTSLVGDPLQRGMGDNWSQSFLAINLKERRGAPVLQTRSRCVDKAALNAGQETREPLQAMGRMAFQLPFHQHACLHCSVGRRCSAVRKEACC
jgi:hypothetical protein